MKQVRKKHPTKRAPKPAYMKQQTAAGVAVQFRRGIKGTDNILFDGRPSIAFVGRSNVGKSSSINAILGSAVARTSTTPGKTQEINFFEVGAKGYFVDLPGYGYARMPAADQDKVRKHILWYLTGGEAKPKLIVLIIDIRVGITDHDRELIGVARDEGHPVVILANKIDKLSGNEFPKAMQVLTDEFPDLDIVPFSAVKKTHIAAVRKMLFGILGIK